MRLYSELNGGIFTKTQVEKVLQTSESAAAVVLTRLKRDDMVFQPERASYRLMKPGNRIKLEELKGKSGKLYHLTVEIYRRYPLLSMLLLYGSRVTGGADELSDYDVLLVLPKKVEDADSIKRSVEEKLGIKLHFTVYSEKAYKTILLMEPYIRMWLAEGIVFDEKDLYGLMLPPSPKMAYTEMLYSAKTLIDVADMEDSMVKKARYYWKALNMLLIIEDMLDLKYDYTETKSKLEALIGHKTAHMIRHSRKLDEKELHGLKRKTMKEHKKISGEVEALGENESDLWWRDALKQSCV